MRRAPPFTSEQTLFWHGVYLAAVALVLFLAPALVRLLFRSPRSLIGGTACWPSTFQSRHLVRWWRSDQITNAYQTLRRDAAVGNGGIDGFGRCAACARGLSSA